DYIESVGYENGTYYGMAPAEFNQFMDSIDLEPMSSHHGSMTYENADKEIADAVAAGFEFVVIPVPPMGMYTYDFETRSMGMKGSPEELTTFLNTVGKKAKKAGLEVLADYILENTDPRYVNFQLDLFWATYADADIEAFIKRHPNRIKAFHVKDMDSERNMAPVGKGTIDFASIFKHQKTAGLEFFVAEQDFTGDLDPMDAIVLSYQGLRDIVKTFSTDSY
ncbi:MAG: sugar phosphate isomerase/epimerase family protein, partial [Flavobacteriaceae bacterium]